ncbi:bacteriocin [Prochlorococcus marinus]|uniref:bacteriocin n=1 Tax=Prochlorococcus TaxID=1218 RepID=UPI0007B3736A|nr:bacteriocin [Prochlorococcus marinus]KZR76497.1 hypothetical protein PMIT1323_01341 [Prochlorococcus marinus str. MIT 1323]
MTDPKENEELNEELSTDELKSVSGGAKIHGKQRDLPGGSSSFVYNEPNPGAPPFVAPDPKGSGSGMNIKDWKRANKRSAIGSDLSDQVMDRNLGAT